MRTDKDVYLHKVLHYLKHGTYSADTDRAQRSGIQNSRTKYAIIGMCLK